MARVTDACTSTLTRALRLTTRETVAVDTPASRATSSTVTRSSASRRARALTPVPFGPAATSPRASESSLDRARGHAADDVALHDHEEDGHGQRDQQHGGGQHRPVVAVDPVEHDEPAGDGVVVLLGEIDRGQDELVPDAD